MVQITLTRQALYELVWSEPVTTIIKRYNIKYSGFRKICVDMAIPLPKAGHWEKIRASKIVPIEPLPSDYKGKLEVVLTPARNDEENTELTISPDALLQKEIERKFSSQLKVPGRLKDPDKLIAAAQTTLEMQKPSAYGNDKGLVTCQYNGLDISVSSKNIGRALRFMDTLIKLLRLRGHEIIVRNRETYAVIEGQEIQITLREKLKRTMVPTKYSWSEAEYSLTGVLAFRMHIFLHDVEWKDGRIPLEDQLAKILAKMEFRAKEHKERKLVWKKEREEEEELERLKREYEGRKVTELSNFKGLLRESRHWHDLVMLRNYIDAVETHATNNDQLDGDRKKWIDWARKKIEWYDPFLQGDDELLKDVDKDKLSFS